MDNRRELVEIGFTQQTLRPGDSIVVGGSPARHEARSLYVRRLDRPSDGFWYEQVGATPRIRPGDDSHDERGEEVLIAGPCRDLEHVFGDIAEDDVRSTIGVQVADGKVGEPGLVAY